MINNPEVKRGGRILIKVIVGYKVKKVTDVTDIEPVLVKLRAHAMQYPGFVSSENLISEDSSIIAMVSTWDKIEDWRLWEESTIRQELLQEAKAVLEQEPRITVYRIMPTDRWY